MIVNVFARQNGRTTRTADWGRDELEMSSSVGRSRKKETNKKRKIYSIDFYDDCTKKRMQHDILHPPSSAYVST